MTELSRRIQEKRKELSISQGDLAKRIGISRAQMNRYESQGSEPQASVLSKIANELQTTTDFLIHGNSSEKAKSSLMDSNLINRFKDIEALPVREKGIITEVISAYLRDFKAKQAYAS